MSILKSKVKGLREDIDDKHYLSWMGLEFAIDDLVNDYKESDYKCDYIYGPPRGGLPIAVILSHRLNIPILSSIDEFWEKYSNPRTNILLVDDIADTGETLKPLVGPNIITYTIYYHDQSIITPDAWVFKKKDEWVVFPWEEGVYNNVI